MKNLLLIIASFLFIGCSSGSPKDGALVSVKKIPESLYGHFLFFASKKIPGSICFLYERQIAKSKDTFWNRFFYDQSRSEE